MTEPVAETLYFAGSIRTRPAQWGTVHAAMRSGLRAAQQVLAAGVSLDAMKLRSDELTALPSVVAAGADAMTRSAADPTC